jgi:hypothetical protein
MTAITIACLDMAGTTVADDGSVLVAFDAALQRFGPGAGTLAYEAAMRTVHETMGLIPLRNAQPRGPHGRAPIARTGESSRPELTAG